MLQSSRKQTLIALGLLILIILLFTLFIVALRNHISLQWLISLITGLYCIWLGIKKMRALPIPARRWYKRPSILFGISLLLDCPLDILNILSHWYNSLLLVTLAVILLCIALVFALLALGVWIYNIRHPQQS